MPPEGGGLAEWERELLNPILTRDVQYEPGTRVESVRTPGQFGRTACCLEAGTAHVGIIWDDEQSVSESSHPPRSYVRLARSTQPTSDTRDSFRRLADAANRMGDAVNAATEQIQEAVVGTANTEEQGGNMPEEIIRVPHTENSRIDLFHNLDMSRLLMQGLDEENWNRHLTDLRSMCEDIPWTVRRGSFALDSYPTSTLGGRNVRLQSVPLSVAQQFTETASNSRVMLAPLTENEQENRFRLRTISDLEDAAWRLYSGDAHYMYADLEGSQLTIGLRALSGLMGDFSQFMQSDTRRRFIRTAIQARMAESTQSRSVKPREDKEWNLERIEKFQQFLNKVSANLVVEENPFLNLPILPHKTLSSRTWGIEIEAVHINGVQTPEFWELKGDGSLRDLSNLSEPSRTMPETVAEVGTANPEPVRLVQPTPPTGDHTDDCPIWEDTDEDGEYVENDCQCGYETLYEEYIQLYQAWAAQNGGSRGNNAARTQTGEWNSPVLRSFHSRGLKYLTGELEPRRTNDTAGVHVHVGAGDLTPEQAVQLTIIYTALEPLFESAYYRGNTRRYCQKVDSGELVNRFNQMRKVKKAGQKASDMRFGSRYWTVNLASLAQHKTVEFRSMGAVYNYEHLVRWAYFCREMVNIAKANVPQSAWSKVKTMKDLVTLFSKYGKETPTPEWAEAEEAEDVLEKLGSENRRVPHTQGLTPGSRTRLVYDDYTSAETYFLGQRATTRESAYSF